MLQTVTVQTSRRRKNSRPNTKNKIMYARLPQNNWTSVSLVILLSVGNPNWAEKSNMLSGFHLSHVYFRMSAIMGILTIPRTKYPMIPTATAAPELLKRAAISSTRLSSNHVLRNSPPTPANQSCQNLARVKIANLSFTKQTLSKMANRLLPTYNNRL